LKANAVKINTPKDTSALIGFEMTGSPSASGYAKKDEFVKYMQQYGFHHVGMKEAKILVTDDMNSSSSKMSAAEKKKMPIVTYADFADMASNADLIKKNLGL
jgi:hypothetical protein